MKKILIFLGLVLLIAASVGYYVFIYSATHRRDISEEKAISITAVALVANYNENENESNQKYLNKALIVEGMIKEIGQDQAGNTTVTIDGANDFSSVYCTLKEKHDSIQKGNKISIKGLCIGFTSDVVITDAIVKLNN